MRKLVLAAVVLVAVAALGLWATLQWLRPVVSEWRAVYEGVDYLCREAAPTGAAGRLMALRIHLDDPGVELMMRPLDADAVAKGGHYRLAWPDVERRKHGLAVLMNTALYRPGRSLESYPGRVVRAGETVIIDGRITHLDPHSYVLWLDGARRPFQQMQKPPKAEDLATAQWGIGLQGIQVAGGKAQYQATGGLDDAHERSLIGFDAEARLLFLIAYENATARTMIDTAVQLGVKFGGAMDGGSSTWLILGPDAKLLRPYTGIRGGRPLGPYLGVRARALP